MTELRTLHAIDNAMHNATMWNNSLRLNARDIQNLFMALLYGDSAMSYGDGGVLRGLAVTRVSGQMRSSISPGVGWVYLFDGVSLTPRSPFGVVPLESAATVLHPAADATHPRFDLVTLSCVSAPDTVIPTPFVASAIQNIPTQRGAQVTVHVTPGTPASSPVAPAVPSGHLLVGMVRVPAGATNLNSADYYEGRTFLSGARERGDRSIKFHADGADGVFSPLELATIISAPGEAAWTSYMLRWSKTVDRPFFSSGKDGTKNFWFMAAKDRKWKRRYPWIGASARGSLDVIAVGLATGGYLRANRTDGAAGNVYVALGLPIDARNLTIVSASIRYRVIQAIGGTSTMEALLIYVAADGTESFIGSKPISNTVGGVVDLSIDVDFIPTVIGEGYVYASIPILAGSGAAFGDVRFYSLDIEFEEG